MIVPTVDTVRYQYLVYALMCAQQPVMLVGPVGTGKTSVAQSVLNQFDKRLYSVLTINMSAQVFLPHEPLSFQSELQLQLNVLELRAAKIYYLYIFIYIYIYKFIYIYI